MNKLLLLIFLLIPVMVSSQVHVRGYYRKNGTYVSPHYRSNPDGYKYNNWSTKGNTNPYTGKEGTKKDVDSYVYKKFNKVVPRYNEYVDQLASSETYKIIEKFKSKYPYV